MNSQNTVEKMRQMRMQGMADVHYNQLKEHTYREYSIEEYTDLLIDQEWEARQHKKIKSLRIRAGFKVQASPTDVDYTAMRNLDKDLFKRLISLDFISAKQNLIITGPTGVGKSYLAQVIGHVACTMLIKPLYSNTARLMENLKLAKLDGTYLKKLGRLRKTPLLILDDFGLHPFDNQARQILMDMIEDRHESASTIVTSQIPVSEWHELIGENTVADAILDRLVNSSHRLLLNGESLRKRNINQ